MFTTRNFIICAVGILSVCGGVLTFGPICSQYINCPTPKYFCTEQNICETSLFPLTGKPPLIQGMDLAGILLISLLSGLGSISGISGGAITVPFSLLFFNFLPKQATAFSNIIALSLAVIKTIISFSKKDPLKKSKTLIGKCTKFLGLMQRI